MKVGECQRLIFIIVRDYYVETHLQSESCKMNCPIINSKLKLVFRGRKSKIRSLRKEIKKLFNKHFNV